MTSLMPAPSREPSPADRVRPILEMPLVTAVGDGLASRWSPTGDLLDQICHYALVPSGKLLRPVLLLESCAAVRGDVSRVLTAAMGTESGHVASLAHDDIIDGDDMRRGRTSVHRRFGVGDAIVAGDAMLFDLFLGLAQCRAAGVPAERVTEALRIVAEAGIELCRGQFQESQMCGRLDCGVEEYDRMAAGKTGALFRAACESGGVLGGGTPVEAAALAGYGTDLGLAFQITDDLLPFVSDARSAGKSDDSDLRNQRPTLPVIYAWQSASRKVRRQLTGVFADAEPGMEALRDLVVSTGGLQRAVDRAQHLTSRAIARLDALPDTPSRNRLVALALANAERTV